MKKRSKLIIAGIFTVFFILSIALNIYFISGGYDRGYNDGYGKGYTDGYYAAYYDPMVNYLQAPEQILITETGILYNYLEFEDGADYEFVYDFENSEYPILLEKYNIEQIAGEGTEFERALNLMNEFGPRLTHQGNFDNKVKMNAISLLEYSLDNVDCGINCRNKAQILNEMCLALGIYARKVWIMPNSVYDQECHVVNEVWDSTLNKWVMLDITNNHYWVDAKGTPLSVLEVRELGAKQEFCTPVYPHESLDNLEKSLEDKDGIYLYFMKNLVYMEYCDTQTVGESGKHYYLVPENYAKKYDMVISEGAVTKSPIK